MRLKSGEIRELMAIPDNPAIPPQVGKLKACVRELIDALDLAYSYMPSVGRVPRTEREEYHKFYRYVGSTLERYQAALEEAEDG